MRRFSWLSGCWRSGSSGRAIRRRWRGGGIHGGTALAAARNLTLPPGRLAILAGSPALTVVPDGPRTAILMELFIPGTPIAYAPSATIAIDRATAARATAQLAAAQTAAPARHTAIILGDPIFDRSTTSPSEGDQPLPATGVLRAMVVDDGPAAAAGLQRGDVLLTYDGVELSTPDALGPARAAIDAAIADGTRHSDQPDTIAFWRDGESLEATLPAGRLGVQLSQAPPAEGLRSMRTLDQISTRRGIDEFTASASALAQIRLYGGTLEPLPGTRTEAAAIAADLASALAHLHAHGVTHGDVKPTNALRLQGSQNSDREPRRTHPPSRGPRPRRTPRQHPANPSGYLPDHRRGLRSPSRRGRLAPASTLGTLLRIVPAPCAEDMCEPRRGSRPPRPTRCTPTKKPRPGDAGSARTTRKLLENLRHRAVRGTPRHDR